MPQNYANYFKKGKNRAESSPFSQKSSNFANDKIEQERNDRKYIS